jgi:hypothetical protein
MLSLTEILMCRVVDCLMNEALERVWNETAVACFKELSEISL